MSRPQRPIRRAPRRAPGAALASLAALGLALAAPARAQGGPQAVASVAPRTISLYPVTGRGELDGDASDVQSLLDAALHRVVQRSEDVALGDPLLLRASCGPSPTATPECLAPLASGGMVVRATVHRSGNVLLVALYAVDRAGQSHGPVTAAIDAYVQSAEPLANAVLLLVDRVAVADRRRGLDPRKERPRPSLAQTPPVRAAPPPEASRPEPAPAPKPDLAAAEPAPAAKPIATAESRAERPPGAWMRPAGRWMTGAGVALLAGGVALSAVNRSAADDLDRRYGAGTLTPADLSAYRRVERANTLTAALFATGGAFTLAGIALWTAPPAQGRIVAGVAGRF